MKSVAHPVDIHVGQKLRKIRLEKKMSQEELGMAVKLTFQQIQKYEKGYNRISCSKLYEFSNVLNININYFFDGITANNDDSYILENELNYIVQILSNQNNSDEMIDSNNEGFEEDFETFKSYFKNITRKAVRLKILHLMKALSINNK